MDKYTLLVALNLPFVIFGYIKAFMLHNTGSISRFGLLIRILFWSSILTGLLFAENIYNLLRENGLTDSSPLSIADVVLVTGIIFSMFLIMRLYGKVDNIERKLSDLQEKISIELSNR